MKCYRVCRGTYGKSRLSSRDQTPSRSDTACGFWMVQASRTDRRGAVTIEACDAGERLSEGASSRITLCEKLLDIRARHPRMGSSAAVSAWKLSSFTPQVAFRQLGSVADAENVYYFICLLMRARSKCNIIVTKNHHPSVPPRVGHLGPAEKTAVGMGKTFRHRVFESYRSLAFRHQLSAGPRSFRSSECYR